MYWVPELIEGIRKAVFQCIEKKEL